MNYLQNVIPSFLIEDILTKVGFVQFFGFFDFLFGNHRTTKKALQNVLKTKEHRLRELATPALKVGTDHGGGVWVLVVMSHL